MSPEISIVVPVYNAEKYLRECLDSLAVQTFADIEVLLVDDGSKDGSGAICDAYAAKDPRFRVVHKENAGPATARNVGLDMARGEYLMFCDADDLYKPEYCARMVTMMRGHDCDAVMCGNEFIYEQGANECRGRFFETYNPGLDRYVEHDDGIGLMRLNILLWNKMFKRSVVSDNGIRFPDGHEHDDDAFCYQYAMCSERYYCTSERLYVYRVRSGSIMDLYFNGNAHNRDDFLIVLEYILDFAVRKGVVERFRYHLLRIVGVWYRWMSGWYTDQERVGVRKRIMSRFASLNTAKCRLEVDGDVLWANLDVVGIGDVFAFLQSAAKYILSFGGGAKREKHRRYMIHYASRCQILLGLRSPRAEIRIESVG